MGSEAEARPLPIKSDSDDEWVQELLGAHRTAAPSQLAEPVAGGGRRAELPVEAEEENEWLDALLGAHRTAAPPERWQPVAWGGCRAEPPAEAEDEWLVELLGAHRSAAPSRPAQLVVAWEGSRAEQPATNRAGCRAEAAAPLPAAGEVIGGSGAVVPFPATSDLQSLLEQEEAVRSKFGFGPLEEAHYPRQDQLLWALCGAHCSAGRSGWREATYVHCLRRFLSWRICLGPMAFKIGIAGDPNHRYHNDEFGYKHEGIWHFMEIMARETVQECRWLERKLIRTLKVFPGCQNILPGGEGVRADRTHTSFVYMVAAAAGAGRSLASARRARMVAEGACGSHCALARRG